MSIGFRGILLRLAVLACACAAAVTPARDFRSAEVHPNDYPTTLAVQHMGKLVAEQSKGKMGIKVYSSGALGTEKRSEERRVGKECRL